MPAEMGDTVVLDPDAIADGTDPLGVGAGDAPPGTYALLFEIGPAATLTVGALGSETVPSEAYAYVGSAFGSNGLGRVDRHRRVRQGYTISHTGTSTTSEPIRTRRSQPSSLRRTPISSADWRRRSGGS